MRSVKVVIAVGDGSSANDTFDGADSMGRLSEAINRLSYPESTEFTINTELVSLKISFLCPVEKGRLGTLNVTPSVPSGHVPNVFP